MAVMQITKKVLRKKQTDVMIKKKQQEIERLKSQLKHGGEEGKHAEVKCEHKHLSNLTHYEAIRVLQYDPIVKAILDNEIMQDLEDVEINGADLMSMN